ALRGASGGLVGTLEFFPEEGKYHYDGHRTCRVRWHPAETLRNDGLCPVCGRRVTVGVLHRVEELADRVPGARPAGARPFESLVPLPEVIADALGVGPNSQQVLRTYFSLLQRLGPELFVLRKAPLEEVARLAGSLVAEAMRRMRAGEIELVPGFDGEYGRIVLIRPEERNLFGEQTRLFTVTAPVPEDKDTPGEARPTGEELRPVHRAAPPVPLLSFPEPLNPEQEAAVRATEGPVIVIAGPGTGKTRTLVYRIAHLVGERGVPPREITAVTFTNRAAEEVRRRVEELLAGAADPGDLTVGTFHGLCLDLLRRARSPEHLTVLDEVDAREVLAEVLREAGRPPREAARWQQVLSLCKSRGLGPEDPGMPADLRPLYLAYREKLASYRALDYDDLLLEAAALVEADPASGPVREFLARSTHLLVDEFQDVNPVQYRLVRLWARRPENLFVIGDPDQAIYGFRGADHRLFRRLKEDFPQATVYRLRVNYRSTPTILRAARALASEGGDLEAIREGGPQILHVEVPGEMAESIAVAREISGLVGGTTMLTAGQDGGRWGFADIAVLFRTGRQAALLEECLLKEGVPYRVVGREGFLEERPVREVLNILRCVAEPEDDWHTLLCLREGRFRLGSRGLALLRQEAGRQGGVWRAAAMLATSAALDSADREKLAAFVEEVQTCRHLAATEPPEKLVARLMAGAGERAGDSLGRLVRLASRFRDLGSFLRGLVLAQEADWERPGAGGPTPEAVSLMTLHAAKGLEFPVVFITGVEDGLLPLKDAEDPDEERRLFYVGLTRARDLLILTSTRTRTLRGTRVRTGPSAFLQYLPPDCLQRKGWAGPGGKKKGGSEGRPGQEQLQLFEF
ncbi:MAG: UvrD-helicase domain-containing protein, partial [Desulfotomaculales bacterium]